MTARKERGKKDEGLHPTAAPTAGERTVGHRTMSWVRERKEGKLDGGGSEKR